MIEWECYVLDVLVFPVDEVVYRKRIGLIHIIRATDRLKHWSNNDIGVNDCEIKGGVFGRHEVPGSFSASFLDAL
jgi:hypothetical protein